MATKKITGKQEIIAKKTAALYKGVSVDVSKKTKPFKSVWCFGGQRQHLGWFSTAESAALAYNKKSKGFYSTASLAKKANRWNTIRK